MISAIPFAAVVRIHYRPERMPVPIGRVSVDLAQLIIQDDNHRIAAVTQVI
jgi:hypothetical protein